jgi:type III restriction enzyme
MHLHFEDDLPHQKAAIAAVCDLFRGQEIAHSEFTVTLPTDQYELEGVVQSDLGIGNRIDNTADDYLLANLREIQLRNGIPQDSALRSRDFDVEMETGTGKTYVYLRSIYELNRRYGFTKFVIVVPSVAIKEGVHATLRDTEDHFFQRFNVRARFFVYDSARMNEVIDFARDATIKIMIVTVGSINKRDVNNLYKPSETAEQAGGASPIDFIRQTNPILIVDEPQSVDGGVNGSGKEALARMNPLCTLRYSATHVTRHHMVYRLDAVDAYDQRLVKQIEVASLEVENSNNLPYVRFLKVEVKAGKLPRAQVELDCQRIAGVQRESKWIYAEEDLEQTTGRAIYRDHSIGEITGGKGTPQTIELRIPADIRILTQEDSIYGDIDSASLARHMIRRTIKEHLDKEKRLRPQGIKVLSLFFISKVEDYRSYDADGSLLPGPYASIFEQEYATLARRPEYNTLFKEVDIVTSATEVHNGYFSIDRKLHTPFEEKTFKATASQESRDNDTYNLIMREKGRLLSLDTPLKFIFSHSALREGWDNPNVFQICAFREMNRERERRQTVGRGLRLCVNQQGDRIRGFDVNTLTVIANESYKSFAEHLQHDIEVETDIRFGVVSQLQFAVIPTNAEGEAPTALGEEDSRKIWQALRDTGLVDARGKVTESLRRALDEGTLALPPEFEKHRAPIQEILTKLASGLVIKDADEKRPTIRLREAVLQSEEFRQLWERIRGKTTYRVNFDPELLVQNCIAALHGLVIPPPVVRTRIAKLETARAGMRIGAERTDAPAALHSGNTPLPDVISELQDKTQLLRRTIVRILTEGRCLDDFRRNPNEFIRVSCEAINRAKRRTLVDGVQYHRISDSIYAQELFRNEELTGYLSNLVPATRSIYEETVCDSETERAFARELESNDAVKLYVKLPGWFTIPTPLGSYNPDWAVLISRDGEERLYFVIETKSSLYDEDLRFKERTNMICGERHFLEIAPDKNPAHFTPASNLDDVFSRVDSLR